MLFPSRLNNGQCGWGVLERAESFPHFFLSSHPLPSPPFLSPPLLSFIFQFIDRENEAEKGKATGLSSQRIAVTAVSRAQASWVPAQALYATILTWIVYVTVGIIKALSEMRLGELPLPLLGAPHQPGWASVGSLVSLLSLVFMSWPGCTVLQGCPPMHAALLVPGVRSSCAIFFPSLITTGAHSSFLKGRLSARQMNQLHIAYGKGLEYYFSSASSYLFLLQHFLFLIVLVFCRQWSFWWSISIEGRLR